MASKRPKVSPVWAHMEKISPDRVTCLLCKDNFKYCGSTSSLTKHLRTKHPIEFAEDEEAVQEAPATSCKKETSSQPTLFETIEKKNKYKDESSRKKQLDLLLIKMIVQDLQPFSVVEDKGFKNLVHALDSRYVLPSRRELARTHLPRIYEEEVNQVKSALQNVENVSLTTDIWTSRQTRGYITVTAHFITPSWELKSVVLETIRMQKAHTAANIAEELTTVCNKWNILDKVSSIVTDNALNMTAAMGIMKVHHLPCFAHTLNLVVRDSIKNNEEVQVVQEKVKRIVTFFHHSVKACDKLSSLQEQQGTQTKKLIQDVETRWNSTFYMMQRFLEQSELVTTTLCLLGKNDMCLNNEEIELLRKAVAVLEPFEEATREMSSEQFTSISKVIPMVRGLQDCMNSTEDMEGGSLYRTFSLGKELLHEMARRFQVIEGRFFVGAATLLDPRFKKLPFADMKNVKVIEERLVNLMRSKERDEPSSSTSPKAMSTEPSQNFTEQPKEKKSIWAKFDAKVEKMARVSSLHSSTGPYIEIRRYMEESPIPREDDPLAWWKQHGILFPKLQELAKSFLCSPASSVPSERLFSKAGELISVRRSCLKEENVDMILFLNKNMK